MLIKTVYLSLIAYPSNHEKPTIQSLSLIFGEDYNFGKIEDG
jgi:hypothetical protein